MKKILTTAAFLMAMMPVAAQVNYTVRGTAHPEAKSLLVGDMTGQTQPETVDVAEGKFVVSGSKPDQTVMTVLDRDHRMQSFFIVDGSELTLDMNTGEIKGSKQNELLSQLVTSLYSDQTTEEQGDSLLRRAMADNQDNVIGAFALNLLMYSMSYDELKQTFESGAPFLDHPLCNQPRQMLASLEKRAPGKMFTDLTENDTTGVAHRLSEYVGHGAYVLVDFWASWCGPCMHEMPNVKRNYEKYREAGFMVVGLSFDRNGEAWKRAIRENGLDWIHLSDLKYWQTVAAETYGVRSIPSSILVDPKGKIIDVDLRGDRLGKKLEEIYGF